MYVPSLPSSYRLLTPCPQLDIDEDEEEVQIEVTQEAVSLSLLTLHDLTHSL